MGGKTFKRCLLRRFQWDTTAKTMCLCGTLFPYKSVCILSLWNLKNATPATCKLVPTIASKEYWSHMDGEEFFHQLNIAEPSHTIPIVWHADGVKIFRNQKAWVYSYSSMVKKSELAISNKMVFCILKDSAMSKPQTHDAIGKIIGYVMKVLQTGRYPTADYLGNPFPTTSIEFSRAGHPFAYSALGRPWMGAFCAWKEDLEARVQIHKLVRNYMSNAICEHCAASRQISFGDFSQNAAWRESRFTHAQFMILTPPERYSSWLNVPGWTKNRNLDVFCLQIGPGFSYLSFAGAGWQFLICFALFTSKSSFWFGCYATRGLGPLAHTSPRGSLLCNCWRSDS